MRELDIEISEIKNIKKAKVSLFLLIEAFMALLVTMEREKALL